MFGLFRKRKKELAAPAEPPPPALGWEAIEKAFDRLYPGQKPKHWAHKGVMRMHDQRTPPENPLDGVSVYEAPTFWHYVSFGLSDLYGKDSEDEWSGFGYEFTLRVAKTEAEHEPPLWPIDVMVSLARAQFAGANFGPGHTIKTGSLDGRKETRLTALLAVNDPGFELQETPFGKLGFLQLVGVEEEAYDRAVKDGVQQLVDEMLASDRNLLTRI